MPVLDDHKEQRPPKRTWRELPITPPLADLLPPPDPTTRIEEIDPTDAWPLTPPVATETRPQRRLGLAIAGLVGVLLLGVLGVLVVREVTDDGDAGATTPTVPAAAAGSPQAVAAALGPAVVQIELGGSEGLGSGVIYDRAGLVLTAHHVVASAEEVTVVTADRQSFQGRVVGRAPERDLAIVAIDGADELTAARIADPGSVEVGEPAIALGSPFGFQQSVTAGIISGLDRELETPEGTLSGLIQTDAPINPGNSGGPLADAEARVIGINTAIASLSGGNDGVGFAVPVEQFADLLEQVEAEGGIEAATLPPPESSGGGGLFPGLPDFPSIPGLPGIDELLDLLFGNGSVDEVLQQLLDDLLSELFGLEDLFGGSEDQPAGDEEGAALPGAPARQDLAIIRLADLPDGYQRVRSSTSTTRRGSGVEGEQTIVVRGDEGRITVTAVRGDDAADRFAELDGRDRAVGNATGKVTDDGLAFLVDDVLVTVEGQSGVPFEVLAQLAEQVEVVA